MNVNDLRVVWDSQESQPLFAVDEKTLCNVMRNKSRKAERRAWLYDLTMILAPAAMAVILTVDAYREGESGHHYFIAALCLTTSVATTVSTLRKRNAANAFDDSIKAVAQRSLLWIDKHCSSLWVAFWCFHTPIAIAAVVGLTIYSRSLSPAIWLALLLVVGISYWGVQQDVKKQREVKREIESLLALIKQAEQAEPTVS